MFLQNPSDFSFKILPYPALSNKPATLDRGIDTLASLYPYAMREFIDPPSPADDNTHHHHHNHISITSSFFHHPSNSKMLYKLIFLLYFLLDLTICGRIKKRNDIDLQTCISNFDIHKDKIIRTQDSRDMGAKYLNEIDLGSREECLRLCCETKDCDVFVFEEKVCDDLA